MLITFMCRRIGHSSVARTACSHDRSALATRVSRRQLETLVAGRQGSRLRLMSSWKREPIYQNLPPSRRRSLFGPPGWDGPERPSRFEHLSRKMIARGERWITYFKPRIAPRYSPRLVVGRWRRFELTLRCVCTTNQAPSISSVGQ